jgi:hypothetical protein
MPFGDGTGPLGQGPGTGRGAGCCSGFAAPGSGNRGGGFFGRGRGGGCGWRNRQGAFGWPFGSPVPGDEIGALKAQAGFFERVLENIRKRIEGLEPKAKPE